MPAFYEAVRDLSTQELTRFTLPLKFDDHFHECLEFIRCDQETLDVYLDEKKYTLYNGDFILVHSFTSHLILDTLLNTCYMIPVKYSGEYTQRVGNCRPVDPIIRKENAVEIEKILSLYDTAVKTKDQSTRSGRSEVASSGFSNLLLGKILEIVPFEELPKSVSETRDILKKTVLYVKKHYRENITLDILAKHCGYSKSYYSSKINEIFKSNLNQYINSVRIVKFKSYFDPTKSIEYQAEAIGFTSKQTFYRVFKEHYGCSPKEYFSANEK